jgi:formate-nitrite transporter family protein
MYEKKILIPQGRSVEEDEKTVRAKERIQEDLSSIPVIIKRNDEMIRHPDDILESSIKEGLEQFKRSKYSLFLSAIAAGLILGFAAMSVAVVSLISKDYSVLTQRLMTAFVYPLGFLVCIMSRTQLFTEHTARAVYPFLDNKVKLKDVFYVWAVVLAGNLVGTLISSYLIAGADAAIGAKLGYLYIAEHLISFSNSEIFISAILAGWLMAQGGWLIASTSQAFAQISCIFVVTFLIGIGGLHHSIAGSAELFTGLIFSRTPEVFESLRFLFFAVSGNLIGGSIFVAILNYGHIKKT